MAQSKDLATEVGAMRTLETAFSKVRDLPSAKARSRVMAWVEDEFFGDETLNPKLEEK
jgi:hypothetical protein